MLLIIIACVQHQQTVEWAHSIQAGKKKHKLNILFIWRNIVTHQSLDFNLKPIPVEEYILKYRNWALV